jgi:hypothetical protein
MPDWQFRQNRAAHASEGHDRRDGRLLAVFGKGGEVASNRLDDQELSVHALPSCLVDVTTLMLQRVLAEPGLGQGRHPCRRSDAQGHGELPVCRRCHRRLTISRTAFYRYFPPDRIRELRNQA